MEVKCINKLIEINRYNLDNENTYRSYIHSSKLVNDLHMLSRQTFDSGKDIFLLVERNSGSWNRLFFSAKEKIIGYCIVQDFLKMPLEHKPFANVIFKIPLEVLSKYPIIISDFVIIKSARLRGYGRQLAEHILWASYPDANISLYADGDGLSFWPKIGFITMKGQKPIMFIKIEQ